MQQLDETKISKAIIQTYSERLVDRVNSDVLIVGAGPAGMVAAYYLTRDGFKATILERRLSPGGGVWGGGMGMSQAVVQDDAVPILDEFGVRHKEAGDGLHTADAVELASAVCAKTIQTGAEIFNLTMAEDVAVHADRVVGVVVNKSMIGGALPVDPVTFHAKATIDTTGHEAVIVNAMRKRGLLPESSPARHGVEGPMDATLGEAFVVEKVCEVFPGLWVSGMSVCAALGGPRMGPIFGGMLLSGKNVAEKVAAAIR